MSVALFSPAFQLSGLVEIANINEGRELFFPLSHRFQVFCRGLGRNGFILDGDRGFLASEACHLAVHLFHPLSGALTLRETHLSGVLVPEQAQGKGAVEAFDNGLNAVNLGVPAVDTHFVVFHLLGNCAHELTL